MINATPTLAATAFWVVRLEMWKGETGKEIENSKRLKGTSNFI